MHTLKFYRETSEFIFFQSTSSSITFGKSLGKEKKNRVNIMVCAYHHHNHYKNTSSIAVYKYSKKRRGGKMCIHTCVHFTFPISYKTEKNKRQFEVCIFSQHAIVHVK